MPVVVQCEIVDDRWGLVAYTSCDHVDWLKRFMRSREMREARGDLWLMTGESLYFRDVQTMKDAQTISATDSKHPKRSRFNHSSSDSNADFDLKTTMDGL